jgi:hypothetical protein
MTGKGLLWALIRNKLAQVQQATCPEFTLGKTTKRMETLQQRYRQADRARTAAERGLKKLNATISSTTSGAYPLSLRYERRQVLRTAWQRQKETRLRAIKELETTAALALLDADATTAKRYLTKLAKQLAAI